MKIPFVGPAYTGRSKNVNSQRCVNLYPEIDGFGGKNVLVLYGTPGLELFIYLSAYSMRGMHVMGDHLYAVSGGKLYRVAADGTFVEKGTLNTSAGRVSMDDNGTQVMVVDGPYGYVYDSGADTFSQITDPDFPGADVVAFLDGYFVFNKPGTGSFMITALYDGTSVDALDIATAEGNPDNLVSLIADHRELWLFGEETTEVWYNSGNADFPFDRIQGAYMETGCAARWSVAKGDNSVFWLGRNEHGQGAVVRAEGYQPRIISTRAIEYQIAQYGDISDAYGYFYSQEGHGFYVLTFPTGNATWVYDAATGLWHERASRDEDGNLGKHLGNCYAFFNRKHYVGDFVDGDIYELKHDFYTDNGLPIERIRRTRHISNDMKLLFFHRLQVDMEMGAGDTNYWNGSYVFYLADGSQQADGSILAGGEYALGGSVNPQAMLRWSDDGGHTWSSERWVPLGRQGEYGKRAVWKRLGRSRDRVFELKVTDPVKVTIIGASMEATAGRH